MRAGFNSPLGYDKEMIWLTLQVNAISIGLLLFQKELKVMSAAWIRIIWAGACVAYQDAESSGNATT